ncbi:CHAT domain-containing protein [Kitasatospora sp. NPDC056327]|uniref:CHAT domain-containing protein n=1 Tax=Kitasatospora sp. NPDC056327 TaxID=3345785 RepID=UPI0035E20AF8
MAGDSYAGDIADHPACRPLFEAWVGTDPAHRRRLAAAPAVPGPIALRSRYRHLLDPATDPGPLDPDLSFEDWVLVLRLETAGDDALRSGAYAEAAAAFDELLAHGANGAMWPAAVHAHIGLGDLHREQDRVETALREYESAVRAADGYRFGRMRALVGSAYLALRGHSAELAFEQFEEAAALAGTLGDPVYSGNALLGAAECAERLGRFEAAERHARAAFEAATAVRSSLGQGNAAQRLGALLHRLGRRDEAWEWFDRGLAAAQQDMDPNSLVNLRSLRGDLLLEARDLDAAEREYSAALLTAAAAGLVRGQVHARHDLARVVRGRGQWDRAAEMFAASTAAYKRIDDLLGMCNAMAKHAEAHERRGRAGESLGVRYDAVVEVESYRAGHKEERFQAEYRARFRKVYSDALAAATEHESAEGFAWVADFLAGRRLAGLLEANRAAAASDERHLLQELLTRADHGLLTGGNQDAPARREREERLRKLRALVVRHGGTERAVGSLDDLLAAVYLPPADERTALTAALPDGCHVLQVLLDPVREDVLRWAWRDPDGVSVLGEAAVPDGARRLLTVLRTGGDGHADERRSLTAGSLLPLAGLLPPGLRRALAEPGDHDLLIIPLGELWSVPWGALPLTGTADGRLLGESARFVVCPSLTIQQQLSARHATAPVADAPCPVDVWRSPLVRWHPLDLFERDRRWAPRRLASAAEARARLLDDADLVVVAGHGRPAPGIGHYLELAEDEWLLPVDLIGAGPPRRLVMITCWGSVYPGGVPSDPVSLATLALAGGTTEILATVGELGDSALATRYVEMVLGQLPSCSAAEAVRRATRRLLAGPRIREQPVHHWAPLVPIGTLTPTP